MAGHGSRFAGRAMRGPARLGPIRNLRRYVGPRSTVEVYERGEYRLMRFGGGGGLVQGRMHLHRPLEFGSPYLAPFCAAALAGSPLRRALLLGLGVGAAPRLLQALVPELTVDVVEIDGVVIAVTGARFGLKTGPTMRVHQACAADFVAAPPPGGAYDVVGIDCYDGEAIPEKLTSRTFFANAVRLLAPGGVLVANVVRTRRGADAAAIALRDALATPQVIPVPRTSNRIWMGTRSEPLDLSTLRARARRFDRMARIPLSLAEALKTAAPA